MDGQVSTAPHVRPPPFDPVTPFFAGGVTSGLLGQATWLAYARSPDAYGPYVVACGGQRAFDPFVRTAVYQCMLADNAMGRVRVPFVQTGCQLRYIGPVSDSCLRARRCERADH